MQNLDPRAGSLADAVYRIRTNDGRVRAAPAELLPGETYDRLISFLDGKKFRDIRQPTGASDPDGFELRFVTAPLRPRNGETVIVISLIGDDPLGRPERRYDLTPLSLIFTDKPEENIQCGADGNGNLTTPLADGLNGWTMHASRSTGS